MALITHKYLPYTLTLKKQTIRYFTCSSLLSAKRKPMIKEEENLRLGRPSNNLKIGVVGLPNVGKSTFFNAITQSAVPAENFPFCTIDPEESRVAVPDSRFDWLCSLYKPKSKVPAYLSVIDIAGLVKGAAGGAGLGNAFLSHIRAVDAIFHVCRSFEDDDIIHVEDVIHPCRDLEIIHAELRIKDMEYLTNHISTLTKGSKRVPKNQNEIEICKKVLSWVEDEEMDIRKGQWNSEEVEIINSLHLISAKPMIYLANISQEEYVIGGNEWISKLQTWISENNPGDLLIPFSASLESELALLPEEERNVKLEELGVKSTLPDIIKAGYKALDLNHYFTAGPDEVRAWTILGGSRAPQAAGVIHSDFEKGFISADVMKFDDLKSLKSEAAVKSEGKYYQKGKDYVVEDGDLMFFKFNVGKSAAKKK